MHVFQLNKEEASPSQVFPPSKGGRKHYCKATSRFFMWKTLYMCKVYKVSAIVTTMFYGYTQYGYNMKHT